MLKKETNLIRYTMKNKTKSIFEPISSEDAKKIKAYAEGGRYDSGVECPSGGVDESAACQGKPEGAECCYYGHNGPVRGTCQYDGPGTVAMPYKCVEHYIDWDTFTK